MPSPTFTLAYFGDGSEGDVTIVGFTSLSREMHYNNLTITGTGRLKPNGYRIFVKGTLTIDSGGSIDDDGNSATGSAGATGFAARNYLGGFGGNGGSGWTIVVVNNANGVAGTSTGGSSSLNNANAAPVGGAGGDSTTRSGGIGGTAPQPTPNQKWSASLLAGRGSFGAFNGGGGGGGGAATVTTYTSGTFISGGGGSGGGIVWVAANTIVNNGRISAVGGNGANASVGVGVGDCAGGGGGGGGCATVITRSLTAGTVLVSGGTGGTGATIGGATPRPGTPGAAGNSSVLVLA